MTAAPSRERGRLLIAVAPQDNSIVGLRPFTHPSKRVSAPLIPADGCPVPTHAYRRGQRPLRIYKPVKSTNQFNPRCPSIEACPRAEETVTPSTRGRGTRAPRPCAEETVTPSARGRGTRAPHERYQTGCSLPTQREECRGIPTPILDGDTHGHCKVRPEVHTPHARRPHGAPPPHARHKTFYAPATVLCPKLAAKSSTVLNTTPRQPCKVAPGEISATTDLPIYRSTLDPSVGPYQVLVRANSHE